MYRVLAVLLAIGVHTPTIHGSRTGNLTAMVDAALTYFENSLGEYDPATLNDIPISRIHLQKPLVDVQFALTDRGLTGFSHVVRNKMVVDERELTVDFQYEFPQLEMSDKYQIEGALLNYNITGKGNTIYKISNFTVSNTVQFAWQKFEFMLFSIDFLEITSFKQQYNIEDINVKVDGLDVEGASTEEITKFTNQETIVLFNKYKGLLEDLFSGSLTYKLNMLLFGREIDEVTKFLDDHIQSNTFDYSRFCRANPIINYIYPQ